MPEYPGISGHGLFGDLQTAALVSTDGTLGWFCCPRFDSPSVFASLLDARRGGYYKIAPDRDDHISRQLYLPDSATLITSASPDGLAGHEGTFSLCTFWYVDALGRAGLLAEARLTLEKMHTYANHLGLYYEEIGATGEQPGNFHRAFSHLSLIGAAINLDCQLDHGPGSAGRALFG